MGSGRAPVSAALTLWGCGVADNGPPTAPLTFSTTTTTPDEHGRDADLEALHRTQRLRRSRPARSWPPPRPRNSARSSTASSASRSHSSPTRTTPTCRSTSTAARAHCRVASGWSVPATQATQRGLFFTAHTCMYWLHTRAADGLIEVESPVPRQFTLGDFFADLEPAAQRRPCRRRARSRHRDRERQALARQPDSDPAHRARRRSSSRSAGRCRRPQPVDWVGNQSLTAASDLDWPPDGLAAHGLRARPLRRTGDTAASAAGGTVAVRLFALTIVLVPRTRGLLADHPSAQTGNGCIDFNYTTMIGGAEMYRCGSAGRRSVRDTAQQDEHRRRLPDRAVCGLP